ncbi:MAG: hypothetical protein AB1422_15085 [bacterium]
MVKRIIISIIIIIVIGCGRTQEIKTKELIKKFNGMSFQLSIPQRTYYRDIKDKPSIEFNLDIVSDNIAIRLFEGEDTNGRLITDAVVILRITVEGIKGYNEEILVCRDGIYKAHPPWLSGSMTQNLEILVQYKGKQTSVMKAKVLLVKG